MQSTGIPLPRKGHVTTMYRTFVREEDIW